MDWALLPLSTKRELLQGFQRSLAQSHNSTAWSSDLEPNQLALKISTYEYSLGALLAIYFLLATGHMPSKFPLDHWIKAVQWHEDSKVAAFVNTEDEWADVETLLTQDAPQQIV